MIVDGSELERGLRWYVVETKPRQERVVERCLHEADLDVFLPWLRSRPRIGSRYQWILEPLFPGYLFSHLDLTTTGLAIRYSSGVRDFPKFGSRIAELMEEDIPALWGRCPGGVAQIKTRSYIAGEPVKIKEGPFSGLGAAFEREVKRSKRVAVVLEMLGRPARLILPRSRRIEPRSEKKPRLRLLTRRDGVRTSATEKFRIGVKKSKPAKI